MSQEWSHDPRTHENTRPFDPFPTQAETMTAITRDATRKALYRARRLRDEMAAFEHEIGLAFDTDNKELQTELDHALFTEAPTLPTDDDMAAWIEHLEMHLGLL